MQANDAVFITEAPPATTHPVQKGSAADLAFVFFASWLFPVRAARRVADWSLPACWLLHVCVGLPGAAAIPFVYFGIAEGPIAAVRLVNEAVDEWARNPWTISLIVTGIFLYAEFITLAIAFVLSSWGAVADERLRGSLSHSLRQTWVRTLHAMLIALLISGVSALLSKAEQEWQRWHPAPVQNWPVYPTPPAMAKTDPGYAEAQKTYNKQMKEFQAQAEEAARTWKNWRAAHPWYLRDEELLSVTAGVAGAAWWLCALLAAVGIRRKVKPVERSPHCVWCGYDLSTMSMESRCPECGQAVVSSLGENAQPGAAWEHRHAVGRLLAWRSTWKVMTSHTEAFGRSLQLRCQTKDHRVFLAVHLPVIFLLGVLGISMSAVSTQNIMILITDIIEVLFMSGFFGTLCAVGTVIVVCGCASLVGWWASLRARRNLLPAAIQVSAYGSTYLVAWAFFGAVIFNSAFHFQMTGLYRIGEAYTGIHRDALFFFSCLIPNAVCGLMYLWLVAKGTHGARFANK